MSSTALRPTAARSRLAGYGHALLRAFSRVPRAGLLCALVAVLNSAAWALFLPPLQAHDEHAHVYYVQRLAESGRAPRPITGPATSLSAEENALQFGLHLFDVVGNENGRPPWTDLERRTVDQGVAGQSRDSPFGGDEGVGAYTPLYYAAEAVVYKAASSRSLIERIVAMRLFSALLAGLTVLFVFLFLREHFPRQPWVWPVGALAVAFQPVFSYMSGAVNPDAALATASAALFYLVGRAFSRGLTMRLAAVIGLTVALGILTKVTMVAFVPAVALAVVLLVIRAHRAGERRPILLAVAAGVAFALPVAVYCVINTAVWDRPLLPGGSSGGGGVGGVLEAASGVGGPRATVGGFLSYAWQDYLPRLGFMQPWFGDYNGWNVWFKSFWGSFGWGDYGFSSQAYSWILAVSLVIVVGALAAAFRKRRDWRSWFAPIATYAGMVLGLLLLIAYIGYGLRTTGTTGFEQGRYLLPLLAPFAGLIALGVSGVGRRLGRYLGVLVVVGTIALTFYAHLLTITRFYA